MELNADIFGLLPTFYSNSNEHKIFCLIKEALLLHTSDYALISGHKSTLLYAAINKPFIESLV